MGMTVEDLREHLDRMELMYFTHPKRPEILIRVAGLFHSIEFVMRIEAGDAVLQFRSVAYYKYPSDGPNCHAVLRLLGHFNLLWKFVKLGWDERDGEVVAYWDVLLADNRLTHDQFKAMFTTYVRRLDEAHQRLVKTGETGVDPGALGREGLMDALKKLVSRPGVSSDLRDKLEDLLGDEGPDEV